MLSRVLSSMTMVLLAGSVSANETSRSVDFSGPSRDQVRSEIVRQLSKKGDFRLVDETYFRLIFEQDADDRDSHNIYRTSNPVNRYTFTTVDTDRHVQVAADIQYIENGGGPFERRSTIQTGSAQQASEAILLSIKNSLAGDGAPSVPAHPNTTPEDASHHRFTKTPAALASTSNNAAISEPSRLGFAAAALSDKETPGLEITAVDPKTPAAQAGLRPADIVMAIDGKPIATNEQMEAARVQLVKRRRGKMKVLRDGQTYDATLRF